MKKRIELDGAKGERNERSGKQGIRTSQRAKGRRIGAEGLAGTGKNPLQKTTSKMDIDTGRTGRGPQLPYTRSTRRGRVRAGMTRLINGWRKAEKSCLSRQSSRRRP